MRFGMCATVVVTALALLPLRALAFVTAVDSVGLTVGDRERSLAPNGIRQVVSARPPMWHSPGG
jgi:hypothetical protein